MYLFRVIPHAVRRMRPTISDSEEPTAVRFVRRAIKYRSLSPDDPFGEGSASNDPPDNFFSAWSGVNFDAFANAAASDQVRTAHFGPEWSKFTTIGRMSVKMMMEQGHLGDAPPKGGGAAASQRLLTSEELHLREVQALKKSLEKNYTSYEEFVEKELGVSGEKDNEVGDADDCVDVTAATLEAIDERGMMEDTTMPLPNFMTNGGQQCSSSGTTFSHPKSGSASARREDLLRVPEPLWHLVLTSLGDPHGDPLLPRLDPLYWTTSDIVLWLTKMEVVHQNYSVANTDEVVAEEREVLLMQDASMQEAFRMARTDGEFLLHHTVPNTLFQVMRRWYLRRQEIFMELMREWSKNSDTNNNHSNSQGVEGLDVVIVRNAVERRRQQLDETAVRVTPALIQETICQCYPYCR